jgi:two-component system alkaline phosphatase synthesis response regulator PhoP/two-component system response regulator VicR
LESTLGPFAPVRKVVSMPGKKIMAVDDERHIVRLIQVNLERSGYQVVTAFDGQEALRKVETEKPDVIVLDVMMPKMDGFEVLKRLQANPDTREIPVIMLTAKAQDADVFRGWSSGVSAYLTKPFNPLELITFVKRILSGQDDYDDGEKTWHV